MRGVFLILGLAAVTRAWSWRERPQGDSGSSKTCKCQFYGAPDNPDEETLLDTRIEGQKLHLAEVEKELSKVEANYRDILKRVRPFVKGVRADVNRAERLQGTGCDKKEFQCGGEDPECISHLLVCDGYTDCRNNGDEDKDYGCNKPAPAGAVFEAYLDGNDPCTIRKPTRLRVAVLTYQSRDYFPTVVHVRASIVVTYQKGDEITSDTLNTDGYYTYGRRALVLLPPELPGENRLATALVFDGADDNLPRLLVFHEASKDVCIRSHARRVDIH